MSRASRDSRRDRGRERDRERGRRQSSPLLVVRVEMQQLWMGRDGTGRDRTDGGCLGVVWVPQWTCGFHSGQVGSCGFHSGRVGSTVDVWVRVGSTVDVWVPQRTWNEH